MPRIQKAVNHSHKRCLFSGHLDWTKPKIVSVTHLNCRFFVSLVFVGYSIRFIEVCEARTVGDTKPPACRTHTRTQGSSQTIEFGSSKFSIILGFFSSNQPNRKDNKKKHPTFCRLFEFVHFVPNIDDVIECRCNATISTRSTENTATHSLTLLCIQSDLGLGDIVFNILYSYYGKQNKNIKQQQQQKWIQLTKQNRRACNNNISVPDIFYLYQPRWWFDFIFNCLLFYLFAISPTPRHTTTTTNLPSNTHTGSI